MKNFKIKSLVLFAIVASFGLKASCPPLPNVTSAQISHLPTDNYAIRVTFQGTETVTYDGYTDDSYIYSPINSIEIFPSEHQFVHNSGTQIYLTIRVYVKQYSYSSWSFIGSIISNDSKVTRYLSGEYLYYLTFDYRNFNSR